MNENEITEVVDEIVDDMDPSRIESEAERLGLKAEDLLARVFAEARERVRN